MRKLFLIMLALLFTPSAGLITASASSRPERSNRNAEAKPSTAKEGHYRRRHRRHRRRGIGRTYKEAGTSAGRGGADFGKNIAHGKPIKAGRRFGKGMGGTGKNVGKGSAKVGRKVGKKTKQVVTPPQ